jgi:hypothetical protein
MLHPKSWLLAACMLALPSLSFAQLSPLQIPISDATGIFPTVGMGMLTVNRNGNDDLSLALRKLEPNRKYTVFLAASQVAGALPAVLLGQFTSDASGNGTFTARTEINDVFVPLNPMLTDDGGIAPPGSGEPDAGAFAKPLNWLRIYQATPDAGYTGSVFGAAEFAPGGFQVASSQLSFDRATPLIANAGPDLTVKAPRAINTVTSVILEGAASTGAVLEYSFEVISTPGGAVTSYDTGRSSCLISFEEAAVFNNTPAPIFFGTVQAKPIVAGSCLGLANPPQNTLPSQAQLVINGTRIGGYNTPPTFWDLAGKSIVVRLTVTDLVGNKATDDVTIRLVR